MWTTGQTERESKRDGRSAKKATTSPRAGGLIEAVQRHPGDINRNGLPASSECAITTVHIQSRCATGQPHLKTDVMIDRINNGYRHGAVGASAASSWSVALLSKVERRPKLG
jgi:hypothetical protein